MGRIVVDLKMTNAIEPENTLLCQALVDTGSTFVVLPKSIRGRLGNLQKLRVVRCEIATGEIAEGEVCGPVTIQIAGFDPVSSEVLFFDQASGSQEALLGYVVLEQALAVVDMIGHRLVHAKNADLKVGAKMFDI